MVLGSILVAACLLLLGWTKEIVGAFVAEGSFKQSCIISLAVFAIYAVDFAINAGELERKTGELVADKGSSILLSKSDS